MRVRGSRERERVTCNFFSNNTSVLLNFAAAYSRVRWVGDGSVSGFQERRRAHT